ncbi:hypothetical protein TNIN_481111 [Trichonephila inaurata madagascariensis]|uniref:Uncharacterized protein n=1 Tax=Trichonephila inaurata madagascariensis TaxID=2747483 RepID=A0A8X6XKV8_9ARAC|nr:hypothetical protein TNIN_481111 [Trichonephila inaurata madagascariensis]
MNIDAPKLKSFEKGKFKGFSPQKDYISEMLETPKEVHTPFAGNDAEAGSGTKGPWGKDQRPGRDFNAKHTSWGCPFSENQRKQTLQIHRKQQH